MPQNEISQPNDTATVVPTPAEVEPQQPTAPSVDTGALQEQPGQNEGSADGEPSSAEGGMLPDSLLPPGATLGE